MGDVIGIAAAVTVILSGIAFLVAMALRRKRAIEAAGFVEIERVDEVLNELTKVLFEGVPREVHQKQDPSGESWLVFVDTGSSDDSGCVMLVYHIGHDDWPAVVLIRSGRRVPAIFRQLTGGIFKWAVPISDTEMSGLTNTGWFAHKEAKQLIPTILKERLSEAARCPQFQGLLGIAVCNSYLVIWSDAGRLRTLLAKAPLVRASLLSDT